MGIGSWGMQSSDPSLPDKLAALKASRKAPDVAVRDFLRVDVGVDPDSLPLTFQGAVDDLAAKCATADLRRIELNGNSLGFTSAAGYDWDNHPVITSTVDDDQQKFEPIWLALRQQLPDSYSYNYSYDGNEVAQRPNKLRWTTVQRYPPGTVLRIAKKTCPTITMYIRIGGLYDDTTPTDLDTMQPVDTSGWKVVEEL